MLVKIIENEIHLLSVYDKSKKDNIPNKEIQNIIEQID